MGMERNLSSQWKRCSLSQGPAPSTEIPEPEQDFSQALFQSSEQDSDGPCSSGVYYLERKGTRREVDTKVNHENTRFTKTESTGQRYTKDFIRVMMMMMINREFKEHNTEGMAEVAI